MKYYLAVILVLVTQIPCAAFDRFLSSCIDRVTYTYQKTLDKLHPLGYSGYFVEEVAKYAVIRQVLEDGVSRSHDYSIVGMIPAGINKDVVNFLGSHENTKEFRNLKVSSVKDSKGQKCYVFKGRDASVWSSVAIVLVWDNYVNHPKKVVKKPELVQAWNKTKQLSKSKPKDSETIKKNLKVEEKENFKKCLKTVNRIYGPKYKLVEKSADKL